MREVLSGPSAGRPASVRARAFLGDMHLAGRNKAGCRAFGLWGPKALQPQP